MAGDSGGSAGVRRIDFATTALFGALYAGALFLLVTGFMLEPSGCGGRFQGACSGETYWRVGVGFGLVLVVAPALHKVVPSVPFEQGVGRRAAVAALLLGAAVGVASAVVAFRTVG